MTIPKPPRVGPTHAHADQHRGRTDGRTTYPVEAHFQHRRSDLDTGDGVEPDGAEHVE